MEKEFAINEHDFVKELITLIRSNISKEELLNKLDDYHDNDIAGALEELSVEERLILGIVNKSASQRVKQKKLLHQNRINLFLMQ
ncbi:MAG: hypothetical protein IKP71_12500 [Candidatus Riflebacteria bacterium]|nr:hypothetical protein [Candidatus Riflebacteria bacterium]